MLLFKNIYIFLEATYYTKFSPGCHCGGCRIRTRNCRVTVSVVTNEPHILNPNDSMSHTVSLPNLL